MNRTLSFLLVCCLLAFGARADRVSVQKFETTGSTGQCFVRDTSGGAGGGAWGSCGAGASGDAPTVTYARQSSTFTTTSTTPSDVSGMSASLTSGHLYHFKFRFASKSTASTVATWWNLTHPAVTDGMIVYNARSPSNSLNGTGSEWQCHNGSGTTSPTSTCNPSGMGGTDGRWYYYEIDGAIIPSADGTLQLQAQVETTTGGHTITIDHGYLEIYDFGT